MKIYSPALLDTNLLVYYHQQLSPFHGQAKAVLETGLRGEMPLCICPQVLMEFYAVITNPKRVTHPISNAVDLTPFVGPFAVAAFGFTREFSTWSGVIFSPGDFRQTTLEQFLALFQGFGQ